VFKKVYLDGEWLPAAKFIDSCGLKGFGYGGAQVSLKHPNFITHKGGATAQDIMNTIRHVQKVVRGTTGILLEPEIRFIGEFL
jgi:UDP-N-acetylmuramate dehydrogenase